MKELEIFVLYEKEGGAVTPFLDITRGMDMMDIEDYEIEGFWGAAGGIRIVVNGYCIIFDSVDFHYLFKIINFLLHSLFMLNGKSISGIFPIDEEFPDDIVVRTTGGKLLHLKSVSENEFLLSYKHKDKFHLRERGDRFFEDIVIDKLSWKVAAGIALDEYFSVLLDAVNASPGASRNRTAMEFYQYWLDVKQ